MTDKIKDYLSQIGSKGGRSGQGASKVRGDTDYYRAISKKAAAARKKKASDSGLAGVKEGGAGGSA
jgi:hypothetical protein